MGRNHRLVIRIVPPAGRWRPRLDCSLITPMRLLSVPETDIVSAPTENDGIFPPQHVRVRVTWGGFGPYRWSPMNRQRNLFHDPVIQMPLRPAVDVLHCGPIGISPRHDWQPSADHHRRSISRAKIPATAGLYVIRVTSTATFAFFEIPEQIGCVQHEQPKSQASGQVADTGQSLLRGV